VPLRLHYRDNVSAGTVFYQNLPLAGGSPLPGEGGTFESATDVTAGFGSPFQLRKAYSAAFPVPGLQYGASYQAWVYYMTHGGYFPAELATHGVAGRPWTFQPPANTDTSATSVEVPFERTRGFGAVRLSTEGRLAKFKAPSIPDGVRPFSQSLLTRETAKKAKSADQPSIILLPPKGAPWNDKCATHSFTFAVYPPSVDLDIWQRCIGFELKTKELRSAVRAVVTETAARLDKDEQDSVAPDDPFVSKIRAVATCLRGSEKGLPARTATFTLPDYTKYADTFNAAQNKDKPLKFVQADPYTVTLSVGPIQFGEPDAQKNCSIQFPVGDVWEIIFRPIADPIPNSVFAAALRPFVYAPDKANEPNAVILGEMRLRVEVASTWTGADKARTALSTRCRSKCRTAIRLRPRSR